jgi:hypothetical protein
LIDTPFHFNKTTKQKNKDYLISIIWWSFFHLQIVWLCFRPQVLHVVLVAKLLNGRVLVDDEIWSIVAKNKVHGS